MVKVPPVVPQVKYFIIHVLPLKAWDQLLKEAGGPLIYIFTFTRRIASWKSMDAQSNNFLADDRRIINFSDNNGACSVVDGLSLLAATNA